MTLSTAAITFFHSIDSSRNLGKASCGKADLLVFAEGFAQGDHQPGEIGPVGGFVRMAGMALNSRIFPVEVDAVGTEFIGPLFYRLGKLISPVGGCKYIRAGLTATSTAEESSIFNDSRIQRHQLPDNRLAIAYKQLVLRGGRNADDAGELLYVVLIDLGGITRVIGQYGQRSSIISLLEPLPCLGSVKYQ